MNPLDGLAEFTVSDQGQWNTWVEANTDPYGRGCVTFAARWASSMERRMAATPGASVADVAAAAERAADTEGITGFMYGAAVQMLTECWVHGEELRRWHNGEYDREDANDTPGAVVNPAILTIKGSE